MQPNNARTSPGGGQGWSISTLHSTNLPPLRIFFVTALDEELFID
jgi:hypothetical protein